MINHSLFCKKQLTSTACHWWSLSFPNSPVFISRLTYFISFPPSVLFFSSSPSCSSCHYTRRKELNWLLEELQVHLRKYMASDFLILTTKALLRAYCMHKIRLSQGFWTFLVHGACSVSLIFSRWLQANWNVWQFNWLTSKVLRILSSIS